MEEENKVSQYSAFSIKTNEREVWDERADSLEVTGPKGDFRLLGFPVRLYFTLGQLKGNGKTAPPPPT